MNTIMKKTIAALLAFSCLPLSGMTAQGAFDHAQFDHVFGWGEGGVTWEVLDNMEEIDLRPYGTPPENHYYMFVDRYDLYLVRATPRDNTLFFVIRDELDIDAVTDTVVDVVEDYIPDIRERIGVNNCSFSCDTATLKKSYTEAMASAYTAFQLELSDSVENKEEIESGILLGLARKHLISEFYGFGETAHFYTMGYDKTAKVSYPIPDDIYYEWNGIEKPDFDAAEAYIKENYPDYSVEFQENEDGVRTSCSIECTGTLDYSRKLKLIFDLANRFGLMNTYWTVPSEVSGTVTAGTGSGHNKLEKKGDVTLDTDLGITDVIALNRNLMVGDPLCCTANVNADINGDGTPDEADSLAILKEIVEITEDFQPQ
ncbi:MAG: hypothetical protein J5851_01195 [Oscillospiraceae bacterium]|nr:hypothetical protein [Oscillospiraceae bacterium]